MKERNSYIDFVKGLAIILVIVGHSIQYGFGQAYLEEELFFDNWIFRFIYGFHMPLFILISGYCFCYSTKNNSFVIILKKKITGFLVPVCVFSILNYVIKIVDTGMPHSVINAVKEYVFTFAGTIWFLWAVFYCSLVVLIIHFKLQDNSFYTLLLIIIIYLFIPDGFNLKMSKYLLPYFCVGYFWNVNNKKMMELSLLHKDRRIKTIVFGIAVTVYIVGINFYSKDVSIYRSALSITSLHGLACTMFRLIMGILGSVILLLIGKCLYRTCSDKVKKFIVSMGVNSLGIYIVNIYYAQYVHGFFVELLPVSWMSILLQAILSILVCRAVALVIHKNRILRFVVFGGR